MRAGSAAHLLGTGMTGSILGRCFLHRGMLNSWVIGIGIVREELINGDSRENMEEVHLETVSDVVGRC
jgi:hypothetical protein